LPNTQKLVTDKPHQEEFLFVLKNKKDEGEKSKHGQIKSQVTKFLRFKVYLPIIISKSDLLYRLGRKKHSKHN